jgi:xanthine dehydrogenase molybdopterin-binding subunit B
MLVARTLRAGVPHARIARLETEAASRVPGVRAIVTGRDSRRRHGLLVKDQPALAVDRVRHAGEVVPPSPPTTKMRRARRSTGSSSSTTSFLAR